MEILFDDNKVNIVKENFDAVIRFGDISDSRMISKKIGSLNMIHVHSKRYTMTQNVNDNLFLFYLYPATGKIENWGNLDKIETNKIKHKQILNSINILLKFCLAGMGIALLPEKICANYILSGELIKINLTNPIKRDVSIIWPSNKHLNKNVRAFIEHFHAGF